MRMELVYSTTHLDQETTRHFAVITDITHYITERWSGWRRKSFSLVSEKHPTYSVCSVMLSQLWDMPCLIITVWNVSSSNAHITSDGESYHNVESLLSIWKGKRNKTLPEGNERKRLLKAGLIPRMDDILFLYILFFTSCCSWTILFISSFFRLMFVF